MIYKYKIPGCLKFGLVFFINTGMVHAISCDSGTEPVLKIIYDAEDHMNCKDPKILNLPPSISWGVNESIIYRAQNKRKREDSGHCVVLNGAKNGMVIYQNTHHHYISIDTANKSYSIDAEKRNGSVQYLTHNLASEVGPYAYTKEEYLTFNKMHVLPGYDCRIIPAFEHDPSKMSVCVAEINNMRIVLYRESTDIVSKHVNWYKAKSVEWICAGKDTFEPPEGVNISIRGM